MNGTYFETYMTGGLALLVVAALAIAWLLWRQAEERRESIKLALEGIGHEFRFNMFQTVQEISDVDSGEITEADDLPVLAYPQLSAVLSGIIPTDKRAVAAVQETYERIENAKRRLRRALAADRSGDKALEAVKAATIDGISTLYLWETQEGCPPQHARSTRSWWVRDWMKAHGFTQDLMPGLALRDAVVENLRECGMVLTPRPLTLTAHEYYSRSYDRKADPRGIFGKRRIKDEDEAEPAGTVEAVVPAAAATAAVVADPVEEPVRDEPVAAPVASEPVEDIVPEDDAFDDAVQAAEDVEAEVVEDAEEPLTFATEEADGDATTASAGDAFEAEAARLAAETAEVQEAGTQDAGAEEPEPQAGDVAPLWTAGETPAEPADGTAADYVFDDKARTKTADAAE